MLVDPTLRDVRETPSTPSTRRSCTPQEQHAKFVEAEEKFEQLMREKGKEFISGDNLKMAGKLKRKLARFAKKHVPLVGGFATGFSLAMASFP